MEPSNVQPTVESGYSESRLRKLEEDAAVIRSNYVTKEDLYRAMESQTWRLVTFVCGFNMALVGATYYIARNVG
jgi:hypothetical protein